MTPILTVNNVSFSYDNKPVLQDVNFAVEPGEFIGMIGPNGGGKTTLLKLLMGFLKPSSGEVKLFGQSPRKARDKIAYVPQTLQFDPKFPISALEVVLGGRLSKLSFLGQFRKEERHLALKALESVGMEDFANHPFGSLSTGQAQRTLIARALVSEPEILLLDEPTASVDLQSETQIHKLLRELSKKMTILMVTHDLNTILSDVGRVLTVHGSVSAMKPEDVCHHFSLGVYHTKGDAH